MTHPPSLKYRILKAAEFDDDAVRNQAKHEDSDGYFGFILGAQWQYEQLCPLLEALAECAESVDYLVKYFPVRTIEREALTRLEATLKEMEK